jgi:hypothetical protein
MTTDLHGLVVKLGAFKLRRAEIADFTIELDVEGGPQSATLALDTVLDRPPRLLRTLVVTYKSHTLFRGRLSNLSTDLSSSMGYTMTFGPVLVALRDHKAFRCVYVDSDLDGWSCDQGPRSSPDTFEVVSRSSGNTS